MRGMKDPPAAINFDRLPAFRRSLLRWYGQNARRLPWRETADPYRIWISEVMLQQTTVVAVVPYFERFLARFPDVVTLARADEKDVLRLWEGLGYYSRARNLHAAARSIAFERNGDFPQSTHELMALAGIGRYTAGAIASFAFDRPAAIVEANTLRLYCRLLGYRGDPRSSAGQKTLWSFAERLLPRTGAGRTNQALMELGATVCTAESPACDRCPARALCVAAARGLQDEIPLRAKRPDTTAVTEFAVAVRRDERFLLLKRPLGERWAGLWDFVRFASADESLSHHLRKNLGVDAAIGAHLATIRHSVTRYRITLVCYLADWQAGEPASGEFRWVAPADFAEFPLSTTGRKLSLLL